MCKALDAVLSHAVTAAMGWNVHELSAALRFFTSDSTAFEQLCGFHVTLMIAQKRNQPCTETPYLFRQEEH